MEHGGRRDVLRVSPDKVESLAHQIGTATSEFSTCLRNLDDEVRHLLGKGWQGSPGGQFHDAFVDWHTGSSDVVTGMTEMVAVLQAMAREFRAAAQRPYVKG